MAGLPSVAAATDFYRTGVTGIEYLGVIRKMAAINFYVRGLNPANMEQGDALAMFTMGTNRKSIAGNQLVEALDLFDRYVRQGKIPPETRHSFSIPADWIKALDPRVKEKIRTETRTELTAKAEEERTKLVGRLTDAKAKPDEKAERLAQHDQLWQARIQNEIGRRIERAHLYSFNLPNFRSALTPAQIEAWVARNAVRVQDEKGTHLDERYERVKQAKPHELDDALSALDPRNTLELDIAREALARVEPATMHAQRHLATLAQIIASATRRPGCYPCREGAFALFRGAGSGVAQCPGTCEAIIRPGAGCSPGEDCLLIGGRGTCPRVRGEGRGFRGAHRRLPSRCRRYDWKGGCHRFMELPPHREVR